MRLRSVRAPETKVEPGRYCRTPKYKMNEINGPSYFIQYDWDEVLNKVSGSVWVMCKNRNENGMHGSIIRANIVSDSSNPSLIASEGFRANLLTHNAVEIGRTDSPFVSIFVAPRGVYSGIHKTKITTFDVSKDGICVSVSGENDCEAVTWLMKNEDKLKIFREHAGSIYKCKWFPSGQVILSCAADMSIKIWCSETCRCPVTLRGHSQAVTDLAIVDRGRNIISVSKDGLCKLWNCGEAHCIDDIFSSPSPINCCSLSLAQFESEVDFGTSADEGEIGTENKIILLGCEDGSLYCVAVKSRKLLFNAKVDSGINCCCTIKPGLFAIGCQDGSVSLIETAPELRENHIRVTWKETNSSALCALSYENKGFFIGHSDGTCVYRTIDPLTCPTRLCLTGSNDDPIYDICRDSRYVYTACRDGSVRKYAPDSYISRHFAN